MLSGTLGDSLLGNLLTGKDAIATGQVWGKIMAGKDKIRAGKSTVREIQRVYQNKPKFNGVYSRNNLPKIKDRAYVISLDK